ACWSTRAPPPRRRAAHRRRRSWRAARPRRASPASRSGSAAAGSSTTFGSRPPQRDRMYWIRFLISASFLVFGESCSSSLPSTLIFGFVVRCFMRAASASGLPLYFAAVSLKEGPSFFAETEWHLVQPLFFASASAAETSTDCAGASDHASAPQTPSNRQVTFTEPPLNSSYP